MDIIQDRGNIKWTAMMLPEHKEKLIELERSQEDIDPPNLDPDRLVEIAQLLASAKLEELSVRLKYWEHKRHHEVIGTVKKLDPILKAILLSLDDGYTRWIEAKCIVDVNLI